MHSEKRNKKIHLHRGKHYMKIRRSRTWRKREREKEKKKEKKNFRRYLQFTRSQYYTRRIKNLARFFSTGVTKIALKYKIKAFLEKKICKFSPISCLQIRIRKIEISGWYRKQMIVWQ